MGTAGCCTGQKKLKPAGLKDRKKLQELVEVHGKEVQRNG
jgi:hypothetical protein